MRSFVFLLFLSLATFAQAETPDFTISSQIYGVAGRLAFSAEIDSKEQIYVLDLDAKKVSPLITSKDSNNSWPSWSPDGTRIAFVSDRDGNHEIYVADWNGENPVRITTNEFEDGNPTWTRDSYSLIYYSATDKFGKDKILNQYDFKTKKITSIGIQNGRNTTPDVNPNSDEIAFSTDRFWPGWDICIWYVKSQSERCPLSGGQTYCRPKFSPDGESIAYSQGIFNEVDIWMVNPKKRTERRLTKMRGKEYDAEWSPNGNYIAFTANKSTKKYNIWVVEKDARTPVLLVDSPHSLRYLTWTGVKTFDLEADRLRGLQELGVMPEFSVSGE